MNLLIKIIGLALMFGDWVFDVVYWLGIVFFIAMLLVVTYMAAWYFGIV